MKFSDFGKTETAVEAFAVVCKVFVLVDGTAYACVHIRKAAAFKLLFKRAVKRFAVSAPLFFTVDINAYLAAAVVCGSVFEYAGVRVAGYDPFVLDDEIRVFFKRFFDTRTELPDRRRLVFKRYGRVFNVIRVYFKQTLRVLRRRFLKNRAVFAFAS